MKSIRTIAIGLAVLGSFALTLPSSAQVMNYQGLLTNTAGAPLDPGQYTVTFNIYDHPTNTAPANLVWGPFRFDGVARPKVNLSGGRFNVVLGPNDATSRSLTDIFNNGSPRFLGITVGGNPEILPRQQILASPTAIHAQRADHATTATAVGSPGQAGAIQILNGNVGIGTSQPNQKLEVAGNASISGNVGIGTPASGMTLDVEIPGPSAQMTLGSETGIGLGIGQRSSGKYGLYFGTSGGGNSWIQAGRTDSATAYDISLQASGGNVGIGLTDPAAKLQITGGVDASLTAHGFMVLGAINGSNVVFDDNEIVARGPNGTTGTLYLQNDGGNLIVGNAASTVTINGTINGASPRRKLTISGDLTKWREISAVDVREWLGDEDGGRIRVLLINRSTKQLRNATLDVYMDNDVQVNAEAGTRCHILDNYGREFDTNLAVGATTMYNVHDWFYIHNYNHQNANNGVQGPVYTNQYQFGFLVAPQIIATIYLVD